MNAATSGMHMAAEVAEQPAVLQRLIDESGDEVPPLARELVRRAPRFVLLVARGTSDHAALYAKYLIEVHLGLPCGLFSPSTLTLYNSQPDLRDVLVLAVSQSGHSPDLVETVTIAQARGATTLAVTNAPESQLAAAAELTMDVRAGEEKAVAATKSYTAELMALYLVISAWAGASESASQVVPDAVADLVARRAEVAGLAERYRFATQMAMTARGFSYPTVREAALKLMETSYLASHAFSGADLMHGPLAAIDTSQPVVAVAPTGATFDSMTPVLEGIAARGADLLVLTDQPEAVHASRTFRLPSGIPEDLRPVVDIVPLQWLALELALARGVNPDAPRGLTKRTSTR